jgi:hypothetical protein
MVNNFPKIEKKRKEKNEMNYGKMMYEEKEKNYLH